MKAIHRLSQHFAPDGWTRGNGLGCKYRMSHTNCFDYLSVVDLSISIRTIGKGWNWEISMPGANSGSGWWQFILIVAASSMGEEIFYCAAVQGALAGVFVKGNDLVANAHRMAAPENWLYPEVELIKGIQMILEARPRALNDQGFSTNVLLLQPLRHSHLDTFSVKVKKRATSSIYLGIRDSSLTHRLDESYKMDGHDTIVLLCDIDFGWFVKIRSGGIQWAAIKEEADIR
ncbi:hypothetical protein Tco_0720330 [Tanacetum coccineum]